MARSFRPLSCFPPKIDGKFSHLQCQLARVARLANSERKLGRELRADPGTPGKVRTPGMGFSGAGAEKV